MHEFGIAEEIVKSALAELEKLGKSAKLKRVQVVIGKLQEVIPENLALAYETLSKGTRAESSELNIIDVPIVVKCAECGSDSPVSGISFTCSKCDSNNVNVVRGMELYLEKIQVEVDE